MTDYSALLNRFNSQVTFADGYSPLYEKLFGTVARWLGERPDDPLVQWLVEVSAERKAIEVTLLLMAGLHRDVLLKQPAVAELAAFYPSVGGDVAANGRFHKALYTAIQNSEARLAPFIQNATVQTNETGRGIFWLLPALMTRWQACHLLDLGASAGLNLVADQRGFQLIDSDNNQTQIGKAATAQFTTQCQNSVPPVWAAAPIPTILSRTGCDLRPFPLTTSEDRATLTSFIWADQTARIERLREGIAAFATVNDQTPIDLHAIDLPDELPTLLEQLFATRSEPLLIYNTFMTVYLRDYGRDLRHHIANHATQHNKTILWAQAEPLWGGEKPPVADWCAWTVDLWQGNAHHHWHIAWVHPHGTAVLWREAAFNQFVDFFG